MLTIHDYEAAALKKLSKMTGDYYRSGANEQVTLRENRMAFRRLQIRPKFLRRDVSVRDTETTFLGTKVPFPIGVAPTAMQRMAHPEGEVATAKACQEKGVIMILSTISTASLEDVAKAAPNLTKWFQLYIYKDREITTSLVRRAEAAGFKGIVLTVDTPYFGTRTADARNNFCLPPHLTLANLTVEKKGQTKMSSKSGTSGLNEYATSLFDAGLTWKDVSWLQSITRIPIIVKGILTAEDALEAANHGVSAVIVSNHGARQLDHVAATIDCLEEVVNALKGSKVEVYLDGGVRTGTDVLKAVSLGAKGVFIGRPVIWGLSVDGQKGVKHVLDILSNEFNLAMGLAGCANINNVKEKGLVVRKGLRSKL